MSAVIVAARAALVGLKGGLGQVVLLSLAITVSHLFGVALDGWEHGENGNDQVTAVAVLCALKTLVDLGFHVWQHRSRQVVREGDGLYGAPATQE